MPTVRTNGSSNANTADRSVITRHANPNRWIVTDETGAIVALLTGCGKSKHARRVAESFFPDLRELKLIQWSNATLKQRLESEGSFRLTPRACLRAAVEPPPVPPPPTPITLDKVAARLQQHFKPTSAAAGAGASR